MNTPAEPEGGNTKPTIIARDNTKTTIIARDNKGNPAKVRLKHNGDEILTDSNGSINTHINGGEVYLNGIQITRKIQKGVENIFQYDTWTGSYIKVTK